jgi:large subunit ribosomal protein L2
MAIKQRKPTTAGQRHRKDLLRTDLTKKRPEKSLTKIINYKAGRNYSGKVTVRHQGGRHKRLYRIIDFKRDKRDISAKVVTIEYDPNRSANIALLHFVDGEKRYILAPASLKIGQTVISSATAPIRPGNAAPLDHLPVGTIIHNLEITPGKGGQLVRSAGVGAIIQSKDRAANIKLPSGEIREISLKCYATIGALSNADVKNIKLGKAGRKRHLGIRPTVRGVAQHPNSHPHGGGEGRSGIGMPSPLSPWGKKTLGKKTRNKKKYSQQFIIKDRRKK